MKLRPFNSRGESGQDAFAFQHCGSAGTFIDIGSNEPIRWNNSYALEEIGWTGVLVEIDPQYVADTLKFRKSPLLTADARLIEWNSVLPYTSVGYLSLDIDENDARDLALTILHNLVRDGVTWQCATIEHDGYRYGDNPRLKLRQFMTNHGYKLERADVEIGQYRGGDLNCKGNGKPFEDWWVR